MNGKAVVHVIDDDESVRGAVDRLLRSVGLEARTYGSVSQFLDAIDVGAPPMGASRAFAGFLTLVPAGAASNEAGE